MGDVIGENRVRVYGNHFCCPCSRLSLQHLIERGNRETFPLLTTKFTRRLGCFRNVSQVPCLRCTSVCVDRCAWATTVWNAPEVETWPIKTSSTRQSELQFPFSKKTPENTSLLDCCCCCWLPNESKQQIFFTLHSQADLTSMEPSFHSHDFTV